MQSQAGSAEWLFADSTVSSLQLGSKNSEGKDWSKKSGQETDLRAFLIDEVKPQLQMSSLNQNAARKVQRGKKRKNTSTRFLV